MYFEIAQKHGSQLPKQQIAAKFAAAFASSEVADLGTTSSLLVEPTTSEERKFARWEEIVAEVVDDLDDSTSCFEELFAHFGRPSAWDVFDDVTETLNSLADAGYPLAIASNFDRRLHSVCEGHAVLQQIATRFVSSEIGYRKPAPQFFAEIASHCECLPSEILMVGDGLPNDVEGAIKAGWQAAHIDRFAEQTAVRQSSEQQYVTLRSLTELPALLANDAFSANSR